MKRILTLLIVFMLTGCSLLGNENSLSKEKFKKSLQKDSEALEMMIGEWEYEFDGCAYELVIEENQEFSLWCACGSPVGNSDLVEYYIYDDEKKLFYLYGEDKKFVETMKGEIVSENELMLDGNLFKRNIPGLVDEDDLFDASKQEPSEVYDTIIGKWESAEGERSCTYILTLDKDGKYTEKCVCGEHSAYENYFIYDEETEMIDLYNLDSKMIYMSSRVEIISEDEVKIGGDLFKRIK